MRSPVWSSGRSYGTKPEVSTSLDLAAPHACRPSRLPPAIGPSPPARRASADSQRKRSGRAKHCGWVGIWHGWSIEAVSIVSAQAACADAPRG